MRIRFVILFLGLVCLASRASAQNSPENFHVELGATWWKPTPEIVVSSGSLSTPVDFINTFPIEKKRFREFKVVLKPARNHKIRYSTVPIEYEGTTTLTQRIRFQGQTFDVGIPTTATLNWTLMTIGYEWDPIATDKGFIGVIGDLKYNKLNAQLTAPSPAPTETFERSVPVPTVGGIGRGYLGKDISITAELTGFKLTHGTFDANFWDFDIYGTGNLGRNFGVQYGYRRVHTTYNIDNDAGDLKMKGTYFGGVLRF